MSLGSAKQFAWTRTAREHARGAQLLHDHALSRPSVSRAYYAAYSMLTARLHLQGVREFRIVGGLVRGNPDHSDLPTYVTKTLSNLRPADRRIARQLIVRLRNRRVDADYRPELTVDRDTSRQALRDMSDFSALLGVPK